MDDCHVIGGILIQLLAALLLRKTLSSFVPWSLLLVLELINEAHDLWFEVWPNTLEQYGEGMKDIFLTMLLPTILVVTARKAPLLFWPPAGGRSG